MAATVKDIAKRTGLGLATISKYLNGGHVLNKNREAIEQAITELDFTVNEFARGLKTSKSKMVGIVIPELTNYYSTTIIRTIEDILRNHGYAVIVCDCRTDAVREAEAIEFLVNKKVDGLINLPTSHSGKGLEPALKKEIPIILLDRIIDGLNLDAVLLKNVKASRDAVSYMIEKGHRKIGLICGPEDTYTCQQRAIGYYDAFARHGFIYDPRLVVFSDYTVNGGYESIKALIKENKDLSAVFTTNHETTLGAIIAINEMGIRIPDDISFIGFDNLQFSRIVKPQLTMMLQPLSLMGEKAANLILTNMGSKEKMDIKIITQAAYLQIGESVRDIT